VCAAVSPHTPQTTIFEMTSSIQKNPLQCKISSYSLEISQLHFDNHLCLYYCLPFFPDQLLGSRSLVIPFFLGGPGPLWLGGHFVFVPPDYMHRRFLHRDDPNLLAILLAASDHLPADLLPAFLGKEKTRVLRDRFPGPAQLEGPRKICGAEDTHLDSRLLVPLAVVVVHHFRVDYF
jgi:hypothetical protein